MKYDVILHVDQDSADTFKQGLRQAMDYREEAVRHRHSMTAQEIAARAGFASLEDTDVFEVVMMVDGPAVRQLTAERSDLLSAAKEAAAGGLRIMVDASSLDHHGIDRGKLWPIAEVVRSSTLELIKLQHAGYTYIKV